MKISQDQKKANRKTILRAAAELIAEDGLKATTMRKIAKAAGVGDATIYNYFPTKEAILYGYYHDHMQTCVEALKSIPDFGAFTLQEQLQTFFDTSLNAYLPDRDFVAQTFRLVLLGTSRDWAKIKPIRTLFLKVVNDMLVTAMEAGEIPDQVFEELIGQFFLDAYIGAVHYWLADRSDGFNNTNIMIDRGLNLACALLKAGVANKVFDIAVFLFKTHVLSKMEFLIDPLKNVSAIKKHFMERMDDV
jgi:AcrR family transcriptional regulator